MRNLINEYNRRLRGVWPHSFVKALPLNDDLKTPCRSLTIQNGVFHPAWGDAITDSLELFDFALKLVVEAVVGDLWGGHDGEGKRVKLACLPGVVIHDGGAVRPQTEQEMVGR